MRTNDRLISIVEVLAEHGKLPLTDLADRTELPKATAHRFLKSLEDSGWVERDAEGSYWLGAGLVGLSRQYLESNTIVVASGPMRELRDELHETVSLSRASAGARICIQQFPSDQALRYVHEVGSVGPLHAGASGKVLLAFGEPNLRQKVAREGLDKITKTTISEPQALEAELALIKSRGWAVSRGERTPGSAAIAVPLRTRLPGTFTSLAIFAPDIRYEPERDQERWIAALQVCARRIEEALGTVLEVTDVA